MDEDDVEFRTEDMYPDDDPSPDPPADQDRDISTFPAASPSKHALAACRTKPNILVTGTPGTGKSTTAELVSLATAYEHVDVGKWVKERNLHDGWDEKWAAFVVDEDKVVDELEPHLASGGKIVEYHGCDFFPERWFDLVVVLRTDNTVLYRRLEERKYPQHKLTENTTAEIMQVVLEEAVASYPRSVLVALQSDSTVDLDRNVEGIVEWVTEWTELVGGE